MLLDNQIFNQLYKFTYIPVKTIKRTNTVIPHRHHFKYLIGLDD